MVQAIWVALNALYAIFLYFCKAPSVVREAVLTLNLKIYGHQRTRSRATRSDTAKARGCHLPMSHFFTVWHSAGSTSSCGCSLLVTGYAKESKLRDLAPDEVNRALLFLYLLFYSSSLRS